MQNKKYIALNDGIYAITWLTGKPGSTLYYVEFIDADSGEHIETRNYTNYDDMVRYIDKWGRI